MKYEARKKNKRKRERAQSNTSLTKILFIEQHRNTRINGDEFIYYPNNNNNNNNIYTKRWLFIIKIYIF